MSTSVFLTIDTEFAWRHHSAGHDVADIHRRSIEPAGVGVTYKLERLKAHDLKACFFVDPMPALTFGLDIFKRTIDAILTAGQEVQLHLHPGWTEASAANRKVHARSDLSEYDRAEQEALIVQANDLLVAAGAPQPVAFRAGSYAANDDTLAALAALGFTYDSSHNGAQHPVPSGIGLDRRQIAPVRRQLIEVPVTVIEDEPGKLRTVQICALSTGEMYDALEHAAVCQHAAMTIVSHGFELANRSGTRANAVHVRRFEALCGVLAEMRDVLPTRHFADRPELALGRPDRPLGPDTLRTRWRQAEQLWSNWVSERRA